MTTSRIARDVAQTDASDDSVKTPNPAEEKSLLRARLLALRKAMTPAAKAAAEAAIHTRLLAWLQENPVASLGGRLR